MAVKLRKHRVYLKHFVLFLTIGIVLGCGSHIARIEGRQVPVGSEIATDPSVEKFVSPYREAIQADLNTVLAHAPETLDKTKGEWQTNIGCMMADAALSQSEPVFFNRTGRHIDISLLNHGGIRANINKGDVTVRTAFEVMPFENSMVVAALEASEIREIAAYIVREKKPHPLAGLTFSIQNGAATDLKVNGMPLDEGRMYNVLTSDYLANGGDNMVFFKKAQEMVALDYKLRDLLIDYFRKVKTLPVACQPLITPPNQ